MASSATASAAKLGGHAVIGSAAALEVQQRRWLAEHNTDPAHSFAENESDESSSSLVFWGVNAFILVLFMSACIWCCCMAKAASMSASSSSSDSEDEESGNHNNNTCHQHCRLWFECCYYFPSSPDARRQASDEAYRQAVLARRQRDWEAKRDSPEKRKRHVLDAFGRCQTRMVCVSYLYLYHVCLPFLVHMQQVCVSSFCFSCSLWFISFSSARTGSTSFRSHWPWRNCR
jgi:hypothetical protein